MARPTTETFMTNPTSPALIVGAQALEGRLPGIDPFIFGAYHQDR